MVKNYVDKICFYSFFYIEFQSFKKLSPHASVIYVIAAIAVFILFLSPSLSHIASKSFEMTIVSTL